MNHQKFSAGMNGEDHMRESLDKEDYYSQGRGQSIAFERSDKRRGFPQHTLREWEEVNLGDYNRLLLIFQGVSVSITGPRKKIVVIEQLLQREMLRGVRQRAEILIEFSDDPPEKK